MTSSTTGFSTSTQTHTEFSSENGVGKARTVEKTTTTAPDGMTRSVVTVTNGGNEPHAPKSGPAEEPPAVVITEANSTESGGAGNSTELEQLTPPSVDQDAPVLPDNYLPPSAAESPKASTEPVKTLAEDGTAPGEEGSDQEQLTPASVDAEEAVLAGTHSPLVSTPTPGEEAPPQAATSSPSGPLPPSVNAVTVSTGPGSASPTQEQPSPGPTEGAAGSIAHVRSVAQDLEQAEAEADEAALAASQRGSSLGRRGEEAATSPTGDAFTEEALQQEDLNKETTPSPAREPPNRPFSPPPRTSQPSAEPAVEGEEAFEPPEFRGLVFHDGVDSLGRPVIVVDADAVAPKVSRKAACAYMLQRLEPIVVQGPYVLVLLNTGRGKRSNRLPAGWLAASYREMSYPFKKNVKHVILVRPSATLRLMLAIMRPLISQKAYVKLKRVENLTAIGPATNLEVTLQHLGPRFAAAAGQSILAAEGLSRGTGYQMPEMSSVEMSQR